MAELNMLTSRRLPMWVEPSADNLKYRLDSNLVRLVHDNVALRYPRLKVGKRFALELALTQWLHAEGLMKERVEVPGYEGGDHGDHA
jgi:hypothetical protein